MFNLAIDAVSKIFNVSGKFFESQSQIKNQGPRGESGGGGGGGGMNWEIGIDMYTLIGIK